MSSPSSHASLPGSSLTNSPVLPHPSSFGSGISRDEDRTVFVRSDPDEEPPSKKKRQVIASTSSPAEKPPPVAFIETAVTTTTTKEKDSVFTLVARPQETMTGAGIPLDMSVVSTDVVAVAGTPGTAAGGAATAVGSNHGSGQDENYQDHYPKYEQQESKDTDDRTSKDYYFDSYAHHAIHEEMLKDEVRTRTYEMAIMENKHLFEGKIILDVGCGTGILSMFAARAGAKHVYAVDCSSIAKQAREIVQLNGFADKITVIQGKVRDVCVFFFWLLLLSWSRMVVDL